MTHMRAPIPPVVLLGRITAILGMSATVAIGLLMLMAGDGYWWVGLIALAGFFPFFRLLHWIERFAPPATPPSAPPAP